jgi:hypothetical protein
MVKIFQTIPCYDLFILLQLLVGRKKKKKKKMMMREVTMRILLKQMKKSLTLIWHGKC